MIENIAKNIEKKDNGIYFSKSNSTVSYPEEGNEHCLQIEQDSFWFTHRNNVIAKSVLKHSVGKSFFDIGGGNGFVAKRLQDEGIHTVLIEPGLSGAMNAKKRGIQHIVCSTLEDAEFEKNSIDSVGLFDVVEHIKDDESFLTSIHSYLKHEGIIYITVPAFNFLWSNEDDDAGHFKRYSIRKLNTLLENCGFKAEYSTYIFSILPLPIFLFRTIPSKLGIHKNSNDLEKHKNEHKSNKGIIHSLMNRIWKWELNKVGCSKPIHFGGSCFVVAKKTN